jgi:uncharacterized protein (DUF2384 family)
MSRKARDQEQTPSVANGQRIPNAPPSPAIQDAQGRAITAQSVKAHALDTFGSEEKAERWMSRPNPLFQGKTPIQFIQSDPLWVEAELVRIDYGVYV